MSFRIYRYGHGALVAQFRFHKSNSLSAGYFLFGALFLLGLTGIWAAHAADPVLPIIPPAAKGEQCVADTALMRTDHMDLLNHQRDETVIDGIRGEPFSLVDCVNCHAQTATDGTPVRIDAEGQFCESCHTYAAVKIDCFTCHAAIPEQDQLIGLWQQIDNMTEKTGLLIAGPDYAADVKQLVRYMSDNDNFSNQKNAFHYKSYFAEAHGKQY